MRFRDWWIVILEMLKAGCHEQYATIDIHNEINRIFDLLFSLTLSPTLNTLSQN